MSLVNDMLRDLDRRKQFSSQGERINGLIGTGLEEARPGSFVLLALIGGALLLGLGGGYLLFNKDKGSEPAAAATLAAAAVTIPEVHQLQAPQVNATLKIASVEKTEAGFSLELHGNQELAYAITERSSSGITLEFSDVKVYENGGKKFEGLSVIQMPDQTVVELSLDREADIELYADTGKQGAEFALVLEATYRTPAAAALAMQPGLVTGGYAAGMNSVVEESAGSMRAQPAESGPEQAQAAMLSQPSNTLMSAAPSAMSAPRALDPATMPLRVTRGLTVEQQDRNTSQSAITLAQSGRLLEAYESLLTFLARNPEAHISRETLGTILLAQREYAQASVVIDEGLQLAPNYSPYKKIKARLLMQEGRSDEALQVLQQLPPTLQADREYHELLATLFQQNGNHDGAIATYQELLRTNGAEGRWWAGMGISLEAQGDMSKALASYQAALQQSTLDASVRQYSQKRVAALSVQ